MPKMIQFWLYSLAGLLLASACAAQPHRPAASEPVQSVVTGGETAGSASAALNEITPQIPPAVGPVPGEEITAVEQLGRSVSLAAGQRLQLDLGKIYTWQFTIGDPQVLKQLEGQTGQVIFEALKPGTTTLSAAGDPLCLQSQPPCGMPSIMIETTVTVR